MAIVTDKGFKPFAEKYAQDEAAFFNDFSKAYGKLLELGVPEQQVCLRSRMVGRAGILLAM
jgi:cytochrome c peroxidase